MPAPVRALVLDWKAKWHKSFVSVVNTNKFCPGEDAKVTIINLLSGEQQTERIAGEFAGFTKLSPCDDIPLPDGCVAVCSGFFCGHPWLTIYQSTEQVKARLQLSGNMIRLPELHQNDVVEGRLA